MTLRSFNKVNVAIITEYTVKLKDGSHESFTVNYVEENNKKLAEAFSKLSYWENKKVKVKYVDICNGKMYVRLEEA